MYIEKICKWADEKNLTEQGVMDSQFEKIKEEIQELNEAIEKNDLLEIKDAIGDIFVTLIVAKQMELKDHEKVKRAIHGYCITKNIQDYDVYKTLIVDLEQMNVIRNGGQYISNKIINSMIGTLYMVARTYDMELLECVEYAYKTIRKRTGKIINGSFVKDSEKKIR